MSGIVETLFGSSTRAPTDMDLDTALDLMSSERRRLVVELLVEHDIDRETDLRSLSRGIAAIENGVTPDEVTHKQYKRVYVGLYQHHLEPLADHDVIDYSSGSKTIRWGRHLEDLAAFTAELHHWFDGRQA